MLKRIRCFLAANDPCVGANIQEEYPCEAGSNSKEMCGVCWFHQLGTVYTV
ncbi:hypothetical protein BDV12DRAFT_178492, partial [Aspergillus spectabilis]